MGLLHEYFAAASDDEAAKAAPTGPDRARFDVVDLPDLDPYLLLLEVEALLCERDEDTISDGPRFARIVGTAGGASVYTVTDELRHAIAAASRERLAAVAAAVVDNADAGDDREFALNALTHHLTDLGDLARRALDHDHRVYAWVSR